MKKGKRTIIHIIGWCMFAVYLAGIVYLMFLAEELGRTRTGRSYSYNLYPFREISRCIRYWDIMGIENVFSNLAGNVVVFLPFGALVPVLAERTRRWYVVILLSFTFSLCIETAQLILKVGSFDVDDLMLNTLGGLTGYLIFSAIAGIRRKQNEKRTGKKTGNH